MALKRDATVLADCVAEFNFLSAKTNPRPSYDDQGFGVEA